MTLSQLDVEALYLGSSFLMADPMGPLLDQDDEEEALSPSSSLEGKVPASPSLSFSSYTSSPSPYQTLSSSPPPSPPSLILGPKAELETLSLSWLGASELLESHAGAGVGNDDAFAGMDWMSEKIDLSEFDLDSLIGSCSSDEPPSSPEDLLASLDSHMDLDLDSFDTAVPVPQDGLELSLLLPSSPSLPLEPDVAPDQKVVLKSEPASPAYTLELGSEVDVLDADKTPLTLIIPSPSGSLLASLPTFVLLQTSKEEPPLIVLPDQSTNTSSPSSDCDSDSGIESVGDSPPRLPSPPPTSSRTKPYTKPEPPVPSSPQAKTPKVKSVSGTPKVVEKKLKKMEQNKTAATRYRQKKRVEQDLLNIECEELEKRNHELVEKAESISREIQYLKDLMEEVRKRRVKTASVAR